MRLIDRFFRNHQLQVLLTYPLGLSVYFEGMTLIKAVGYTTLSWTLAGGWGLMILGFVIAQMSYMYYKFRYTESNIHIRSDTGQPVMIDGDDIDGDGRGGDTLRRMGIID